MERDVMELLKPRDAAAYLGLAVTTLAKIRCISNDGPVFIRLGRKVMYRREDLDAWLNDRQATSTSDADRRLPRSLINPDRQRQTLNA